MQLKSICAYRNIPITWVECDVTFVTELVMPIDVASQGLIGVLQSFLIKCLIFAQWASVMYVPIIQRLHQFVNALQRTIKIKHNFNKTSLFFLKCGALHWWDTHLFKLLERCACFRQFPCRAKTFDAVDSAGVVVEDDILDAAYYASAFQTPVWFLQLLLPLLRLSPKL